MSLSKRKIKYLTRLAAMEKIKKNLIVKTVKKIFSRTIFPKNSVFKIHQLRNNLKALNKRFKLTNTTTFTIKNPNYKLASNSIKYYLDILKSNNGKLIIRKKKFLKNLSKKSQRNIYNNTESKMLQYHTLENFYKDNP